MHLPRLLILNHLRSFLLLAGLGLLPGCQAPLPVIDQLEPFEGKPGDLIRIMGSGLDYRSGLYLNDELVPDTRVSGDNTRLDFRVPDDAEAGEVSIYLATEEGSSNTVGFRVLPAVLSMEPAQADIGEEILLVTNFRKTDLKVLFPQDILTSAASIQDFAIRVTVPDSTESGLLTLLLANGDRVLFEDFYLNAPPVLEQISPATGWPGREVTMTGRNFPEGETEVIFQPDVPASISSQTFFELKVLVPEGAESGMVKVRTPYGIDSIGFTATANPGNFPFIDQLIPSRIAWGCELRIAGGNFLTGNAVVNFSTGTDTLRVSGNDLTISPDGKEIRVAVPTGAETGEVTVTTGLSTSLPATLTIVEMPEISRVIPARNNLGGQVILEVTDGQLAQRVFFGSQPISGNNGAFEYRKFGPGDEIIATNVPLTLTNPDETIYLEVSEGCYSNGVPFGVVTGSTSPNAPLAGASHTVLLPTSSSSLVFINNDWLTVSGKFSDPAAWTVGTTSFEFCGCEDSLGNILLFEPNSECYFIPGGGDGTFGYYKTVGGPPGLAVLCSDYPASFAGRSPAGIIRGSRVEIFGEFVGRINPSLYGAGNMTLSPVESGDQLDLTFPDYIESITPGSGPPGTVVTLKGRFAQESVISYDDWINLPAQQFISNTEIRVTIPDDPDPIEIFGNHPFLLSKYPDGTESNSVNFEIRPPMITGLSPASGPTGTQITLTGEFALRPAPDDRLELQIAGELVPFTVISPTQLSFTIPASLGQPGATITLPVILRYWYLTFLESQPANLTITP